MSNRAVSKTVDNSTAVAVMRGVKWAVFRVVRDVVEGTVFRDVDNTVSWEIDRAVRDAAFHTLPDPWESWGIEA